MAEKNELLQQFAGCPNTEKIAVDCACPEDKGCVLRGHCCACVKAHREGKSLPACLR